MALFSSLLLLGGIFTLLLSLYIYLKYRKETRMSAPLWKSEERRNFFYMYNLIFDVARNQLRKVFIREWNTRYRDQPGAWDDTPVSGRMFYSMEYSGNAPGIAYRRGDTKQWDCTALMDAIVETNAIGAGLNPKIRKAVLDLRQMRNFLAHHPGLNITTKVFNGLKKKALAALTILGMSNRESVRINNHYFGFVYDSFNVLPPKPTHKVIYRSDEIQEITEYLEKLRSDNFNRLTYFYLSGSSGKSQIVRQVFENIFIRADWEAKAMFVMTLDGRDLDSLLYSYKKFCHHLGSKEKALELVFGSSKTTEEKIKVLRSKVYRRIRNWIKWWIIVVNVESLELISSLLPQTDDEVWNNGQILVTTQVTNEVPPDSISTKHLSLSPSMNDKECCQLLAQLSKTDANDPLLGEVAEKLDRQPLAMVAAAEYMKQSSPKLSWRDYLRIFENDTSELIKMEINSATSFTMLTSVLLAVEKYEENNKISKKCCEIFRNAFKLFSLISFEPLPLNLVVKYIRQHKKELDTKDIIRTIKHCPLFLHVVNKEEDIRLHRVAIEAIKVSKRKANPDAEDKKTYQTLKGFCEENEKEIFEKFKKHPDKEALNHVIVYRDEKKCLRYDLIHDKQQAVVMLQKKQILFCGIFDLRNKRNAAQKARLTTATLPGVDIELIDPLTNEVIFKGEAKLDTGSDIISVPLDPKIAKLFVNSFSDINGELERIVYLKIRVDGTLYDGVHEIEVEKDSNWCAFGRLHMSGLDPRRKKQFIKKMMSM
ncbi:uncharacterized protein LOC114537224 [Dendronephthya gigantea]|uniref:uncharacterized protein LOC114537224 n=1 Tax=Dendronephthya gigantea TaxID=151771 RepID=UPI00106D535B|nr:uncharacterized protein LOC114537224 [Dendronephthya gigantea]XP_028414163.1 uncharacterized protein LOC114537224 [Dendronephthya gigantea]